MSETGSPTKKMKVSPTKSQEEQEEEWLEVFQFFDKDKNGKVSSSELGSLLRGLGYNPSDEDVHHVLCTMDHNNSGMIEWEEFKKFMKDLKMPRGQEQRDLMLNAFQFFDYNGDDHIDANELRKVMTTCGEPLTDDQVDQMISVADIDKDGRINYKEFVNFIFSENS